LRRGCSPRIRQKKKIIGSKRRVVERKGIVRYYQRQEGNVRETLLLKEAGGVSTKKASRIGKGEGLKSCIGEQDGELERGKEYDVCFRKSRS